MISYKVIYKEIQMMTTELIACGLSVKQNFPSCELSAKDRYEISYSGMQDISIALKNVRYQEIYNELDRR